MNTSVRWINDYLDPPATAQQQADALTLAGFPIESAESIELPSGFTDTRQNVELTSNRGDCLCHIGLAREVAAVTGRALRVPSTTFKTCGTPASRLIAVENRDKQRCPLYTARVIRGVKVGPSTAWVQERLLARGDIPRNNIVDASNFVLFEFGQPTHVFDLATIRGARIVVRRAHSGERFLPIGEGASAIALDHDDLVIADAERAIGIAGVKGGAETAVTAQTRDILIEAASFAPAVVRTSSRSHGIASDAAYRFERGVSPGQVNAAADRLVELILELCGGEVCDGIVADGIAVPPSRTVTMRCERCRAIIGLPMQDESMCELLNRLGLKPQLDRGTIHCTIPAERQDLTREVDLIEEVARLQGLDSLNVSPTVHVRVAPLQPADSARRAVNDALAGMGYLESITHSLVSEQAAAVFCPPGMNALKIEDHRAGAEPVLRPSILPSLLRVIARNQDNGMNDVRLFESASVFGLMNDQHIERVNLALVAPADSCGLREIRGVIDRLAHLVLGDAGTVHAEPQQVMPWFSPGAVLRLDGEVLGLCGVIAPTVTQLFGVDCPVVGAEIGLPQHYSNYPPAVIARPLPAHPAIARDLSPILDDRTPWLAVRETIDALRLDHAEAVEFVTTYRGKQLGSGRKSLTLRVRFRAPDRTLTHDEVDPQMQRVMDVLKATFKAEFRT